MMSDSADTSQKLLHDLRNPLAAIYTAVSILGEMPDETTLASIRRHLVLIEQATTQGRELIDAAQLKFDSAGANLKKS